MRNGELQDAGASVATGRNWPREELLRLPAVMQRVGLRKTAIYQKIRLQEFPRPVALGTRARAWRASDIERWIAERS